MSEINHFKLFTLFSGDIMILGEMDSSYVERIDWDWFVYIVIEDIGVVHPFWKLEHIYKSSAMVFLCTWEVPNVSFNLNH
jgi:hypothetical protein